MELIRQSISVTTKDFLYKRVELLVKESDLIYTIQNVSGLGRRRISKDFLMKPTTIMLDSHDRYHYSIYSTLEREREAKVILFDHLSNYASKIHEETRNFMIQATLITRKN